MRNQAIPEGDIRNARGANTANRLLFTSICKYRRDHQKAHSQKRRKSVRIHKGLAARLWVPSKSTQVQQKTFGDLKWYSRFETIRLAGSVQRCRMHTFAESYSHNMFAQYIGVSCRDRVRPNETEFSYRVAELGELIELARSLAKHFNRKNEREKLS